ncbi:hypothetical protein PMM47T1_02759 [Pseudomonas sp. M47T1]|uniref:DUF4917 family protein n=1 Tax=Pseudomonas sp. M47T1 TaxID=1179778 RepID=UPI0002607F6C|nr:DUF4917 family protein [Pseudomonas sp. M47T1]EIK98151.1 hypothetical protein PMM47T1_02759 [Pseudomonas sp. M47T1]
MELDAFDASLGQWPHLHFHCTGLLLGNGASRAMWRNFAYDSLFERAQKVRNKPLGQTDLALFKSMGTENFEQVLSALNVTIRVNAALAISASAPLNRYYAIKEALIHAMRSVHIPFRLVPTDALQGIASHLRQYATVYSSNYDLLLSWAIEQAAEGFDDLFDVDQGFDVRRTRSEATRVLHLHGGLHLIRQVDGTTRKRNALGSALLDGFAINQPGEVPLFVNEGRCADKQRAIRQSDYLSWCHGQLAGHQGPLCLFGHSLGEQDRYLLDAIEQADVQQLAISIFPLSDAWIISQKRYFTTLFRGRELHFFDTTSHPLGAPALNVPVPKPVVKRKR